MRSIATPATSFPPLVTCTIVAICVAVHLALGLDTISPTASVMTYVPQGEGEAQAPPADPAATDQNKHAQRVLLRWAITPAAVVYQLQFFRLITSCFTHFGVMHIGMNMLNVITVGAAEM